MRTNYKSARPETKEGKEHSHRYYNSPDRVHNKQDRYKMYYYTFIIDSPFYSSNVVIVLFSNPSIDSCSVLSVY